MVARLGNRTGHYGGRTQQKELDIQCGQHALTPQAPVAGGGGGGSRDGQSRTGDWQKSLLRPWWETAAWSLRKELTRGREGLGPRKTWKDEGLGAREQGSIPGTEPEAKHTALGNKTRAVRAEA